MRDPALHSSPENYKAHQGQNEVYQSPSKDIIDSYILNKKIELLSLLGVLYSNNDMGSVCDFVRSMNDKGLSVSDNMKDEHRELLNTSYQLLSSETPIFSPEDTVETLLGSSMMVDDVNFYDLLPSEVKDSLSVNNLKLDYILDELDETISDVITSMINRFREVLDKEKMNIELYKDHLTGIGNRRSFDLSLSGYYEMDIVDRGPITVIMFDLDKFKGINDTFGHGVGDDVLKEVANIIRSIARNYSDEESGTYSDIGRLGGEEFGIIFTNKTKEEIAKIGEEIQNELLSIKIVSDDTHLQYKISASFGAFYYDGDEKLDSEWVMKKIGDGLSYKAKRKGGARFYIGDKVEEGEEKILTGLKSKEENIDVEKVLYGISRDIYPFIATIFSEKDNLVRDNDEIINNDGNVLKKRLDNINGLGGINGSSKEIAYFIFSILDKKGFGKYDWLKIPLYNYIQEYIFDISKHGQIEFLQCKEKESHFEGVDLLLTSSEMKNFLNSVNENKTTKECSSIDEFIKYLAS